MNCLRTLLNRLADAASYWLQTPFDAADELWNELRLRDGADRLAEREAEEEVTPAQFDEMWNEATPVTTTTNGTGGGNYRVNTRPSSTWSGFGGMPRDGSAQLDRLDRILGRLEEVVENIHTAITSAAPGIRSSVDAADGPRGTAAQPETRAGHPPCSAVKPDTTWAICTKPRGHESAHGYGGIFWDDESPQ